MVKHQVVNLGIRVGNLLRIQVDLCRERFQSLPLALDYAKIIVKYSDHFID
jgi:hypothetical protein